MIRILGRAIFDGKIIGTLYVADFCRVTNAANEAQYAG